MIKRHALLQLNTRYKVKMRNFQIILMTLLAVLSISCSKNKVYSPEEKVSIIIPVLVHASLVDSIKETLDVSIADIIEDAITEIIPPNTYSRYELEDMIFKEFHTQNSRLRSENFILIKQSVFDNKELFNNSNIIKVYERILYTTTNGTEGLCSNLERNVFEELFKKSCNC